MTSLRSGLSVIMLCSLFAAEVNAETAVPELSKERVIFHTNFGDLAVALFPKVAPQHSAQILKLVAAGVYTGTQIFRVEPGFVAQVANYDLRTTPLTEAERATVHKLPAEFSKLVHHRGILSMARYDDPNSAEASFSFMFGDAPHLDGQYTIFGELVAGQDVLEAIEHVPTDAATSTPQVPITINSAEVVSAAQLSQMKLVPAQLSEMPNPKSRLIFEIFAGLMFSVTVAIPIIKTAMMKPPAPKGPAKAEKSS